MENFKIKMAAKEDAPIVLDFIKKLAEYEKLSHEVTATVEDLNCTLFSENSNTQAVIGYLENQPVSVAIFFHNYSTFLGKKGLYLEDLFVLPKVRGKGIGKSMLKYLAKIALERDCGRFEWSVLDWNEPAINFYKNIGAEIKKEWLTTRISGKSLVNLANS